VQCAEVARHESRQTLAYMLYNEFNTKDSCVLVAAVGVQRAEVAHMQERCLRQELACKNSGNTVM